MDALKVLFIVLTSSYIYHCVPELPESYKLVDEEGEEGDEFGVSGHESAAVAVSENYVVIGAYTDDDTGSTDCGSIVMFKRNGSTIETKGTKKVPIRKRSSQYFGFAVDVNRDFIVVGAYSGDPDGNKVFVYATDDNFPLRVKMAQPEAGRGAFGHSVSINEDNLMLVGRMDGKVHVFEHSNSTGTDTWSLLHRLQRLDTRQDDLFGWHVTASSDHMVVTCNGCVYVYHKESDGTWNVAQPQVFSPAESWFGYHADIEGGRMVVGAYGAQKAYVYEVLPDGTWNNTAILTGSKKVGGDRFGIEVALYKNVIVVAADRADVTIAGTNKAVAGLAYVFEFDATLNTWVEKAILYASDARANDALGGSLALYDKHVFVASMNNARGTRKGAVYVFGISNVTSPEPTHAPTEIPNDTSPEVSTNTTSEAPDIDVTCHREYFQAMWEKSSFSGALYFNVSLRNESCNELEGNGTHIYIASNFSECGTLTTVDGNLIQQHNTITLIVTYFNDGVITRQKTFIYNVGCQFDRNVNVSSSNTFIASKSVTKADDVFEDKEFNVNMQIYTTSTFIAVAGNPHKVEPPEPLYIRISEADELFKFVVVECYASPAQDLNKVLYTFFTNKCPVDPTFITLHHDNDRFDFTIHSFQFISVTQSVVMHCRLLACPITSSSEQCNQTCVRRKRRAITEETENEKRETKNETPLKIVNLSSQECVFADMKSCTDITCGQNSVCVDAYPAVCTCVEPFVFVDGVCTKERTFKLENIHVETEFFDVYRNPYSAEFVELSTRISYTLRMMIPESKRNIVKNIKVVNPRRGSVIVDAIVAYHKESNRTHVHKEIVDAIKNSEMVNRSSSLYIRSDVIPTLAKLIEEERSYIFLVGVFVPMVTVLLMVVFFVCWRHRLRKVKNGDVNGKFGEEVEGKVNMAAAFNEL